MADARAEDGQSAKSSNLFLQIVEHLDGSITRPFVPDVPPVGDDPDAAVLSRDVALSPADGTWLRVYRPNPLPAGAKLPIVLYFHGGGFVLFSAATVFYHAYCEAMACAVPALVVSLEYRLAPEHRLPAAYEDAVQALLWIREQARDPATGDAWLADHGDFSHCFLMGSSSGANIAYHAALRAAALDLFPARLAGVVLNQPYFGGVERKPSEARSEEDPMLPLGANDMLWRLALPKGSDRDQAFCNPAAATAAGLVRLLPRCLVHGCEGDPLVDRQKELVRVAAAGGARVVARFDGGGFHAVELFDPARAEALFARVREFFVGTIISN